MYGLTETLKYIGLEAYSNTAASCCLRLKRPAKCLGMCTIVSRPREVPEHEGLKRPRTIFKLRLVWLYVQEMAYLIGPIRPIESYRPEESFQMHMSNRTSKTSRTTQV